MVPEIGDPRPRLADPPRRDAARLRTSRPRRRLVCAADLEKGFEFNGERIPLWSERRGIWRPRQLKSPGAALTIVTAPRLAGRKPAYDDEIAADDRGWFGYKYEGTDPAEWTNVAVRREYQTAAVKRRLHQHRFREMVLGAYRRRCSMCHLGHVLLLDAAHIIPDHDDRGLPEIPNGLALCKIHHSAYDTNILGISPDLLVHVREDILREIDGPMLEHGLKGMAGRTIVVPRSVGHRPNPAFLDERFRRFRAA